MYTALVTSDVVITWDRSQTVIPAGTVLQLLPGGPLETAIGAGNLQDISGSDQNLPLGCSGVSN
jgi:hypothetical protein